MILPEQVKYPPEDWACNITSYSEISEDWACNITSYSEISEDWACNITSYSEILYHQKDVPQALLRDQFKARLQAFKGKGEKTASPP